MSFEELVEEAAKHLHIVGASNQNSPYNQLVIGEMHYLPRVQCDLLRALITLNQGLGMQLIGKEGLPLKSIPSDTDIEKAIRSRRYMRELLKRRINAVTLFGNAYPEITVEAVDDSRLRELSSYIDKRCHELFLVKQEKGWQNMTEDERMQYSYWFGLLKNILLGDRSDFMVRNLYNIQRHTGIRLAVLLCGAGHTPYREEYRSYSALRTLQSLHLNYIVAIVPSALPFLNKTEPFDFYSKSDKTEVSPHSTSQK